MAPKIRHMRPSTHSRSLHRQMAKKRLGVGGEEKGGGVRRWLALFTSGEKRATARLYSYRRSSTPANRPSISTSLHEPPSRKHHNQRRTYLRQPVADTIACVALHAVIASMEDAPGTPEVHPSADDDDDLGAVFNDLRLSGRRPILQPVSRSARKRAESLFSSSAPLHHSGKLAAGEAPYREASQRMKFLLSNCKDVDHLAVPKTRPFVAKSNSDIAIANSPFTPSAGNPFHSTPKTSRKRSHSWDSSGTPRKRVRELRQTDIRCFLFTKTGAPSAPSTHLVQSEISPTYEGIPKEPGQEGDLPDAPEWPETGDFEMDIPQMDGAWDGPPPPPPPMSQFPLPQRQNRPPRGGRNRARPTALQTQANFIPLGSSSSSSRPSGQQNDQQQPAGHPLPSRPANAPASRYEDGEVRRYGAGESYRPYNRDRSPRPNRSPRPARSPPPRERGRTPPPGSDSYVPGRSPRRRSRSGDRGGGVADRYRRERSREAQSWRRDRSRSRPRSPIRRSSPRRSPMRRNSPPRYGSPRRDRDDRNDRRSPRRDFDRDRDIR